jgi:hypothetical protein
MSYYRKLWIGDGMKKAARTLPRSQRKPRWEPGWKEDATDAEGSREAG